ncbi:MAG: hypothetical protein WBC59_07920, partial [Phycisphaerae bacterium]
PYSRNTFFTSHHFLTSGGFIKQERKDATSVNHPEVPAGAQPARLLFRQGADPPGRTRPTRPAPTEFRILSPEL